MFIETIELKPNKHQKNPEMIQSIFQVLSSRLFFSLYIYSAFLFPILSGDDIKPTQTVKLSPAGKLAVLSTSI